MVILNLPIVNSIYFATVGYALDWNKRPVTCAEQVPDLQFGGGNPAFVHHLEWMFGRRFDDLSGDMDVQDRGDAHELLENTFQLNRTEGIVFIA